MRRVQALELEDQTWMPSVLREAGTACLRFAPYRPTRFRTQLRHKLGGCGEYPRRSRGPVHDLQCVSIFASVDRRTIAGFRHPRPPSHRRDRFPAAQATRAIGNDLYADYHIVRRAVLAALSPAMVLEDPADSVLHCFGRDRFGHADLQRRRAPRLIRKVRRRGLVQLECADNPHGPSTRSGGRAARHTPVECSGAWSRAVRQTCRGRSCQLHNFGLRDRTDPL